jgi:hypothetical protein
LEKRRPRRTTVSKRYAADDSNEEGAKCTQSTQLCQWTLMTEKLQNLASSIPNLGDRLGLVGCRQGLRLGRVSHLPVELLQGIERLFALAAIRDQSFAIVEILYAGKRPAR